MKFWPGDTSDASSPSGSPSSTASPCWNLRDKSGIHPIHFLNLGCLLFCMLNNLLSQISILKVIYVKRISFSQLVQNSGMLRYELYTHKNAFRSTRLRWCSFLREMYLRRESLSWDYSLYGTSFIPSLEDHYTIHVLQCSLCCSCRTSLL